MAHSGLRYPIAFRRDFNLNVTENRITGWAERYGWDYSLVGGGTGSILSFTSWDTNEPVFTYPNHYRWACTPRNFGGALYQPWYQLDVLGGTAGWDRLGGIDVIGIGTVVQWKVLPANDPRNGWRFAGRSFYTILNPLWFRDTQGDPKYTEPLRLNYKGQRIL